MKTPLEQAKEFAQGMDAALLDARRRGASPQEIEQLEDNARAAWGMYQAIAEQSRTT